MTELTQEQISIYSDAHKEAYGFRPRGYTPDTVAQFDRDMEGFIREMRQNDIDERTGTRYTIRDAYRAIRLIQRTVQGCTIERAFALFLDSVAADCHSTDWRNNPQDFDHILWDLGIRVGKWKHIRRFAHNLDLLNWDPVIWRS